MINQCLKAAWKQAAFSCLGLGSSEGIFLSGGEFVVDVESNDMDIKSNNYVMMLRIAYIIVCPALILHCILSVLKFDCAHTAIMLICAFPKLVVRKL